uniref:3'-phosphate/5'-hydroxy nucleic acid ligase n=1 Tax=viral metagenome TaxID=1070528 RepID=A0A6M3L9F1_9ZZZZ
MIKVYSDNKIPIKSWVTDIEDSALKQANNLANLPFAFRHVALMPDCHQGYGMPIGGVLATKDVIIPNAVGVDIGCGMCAIRTSLKEIPTDELKKIMGYIRDAIPVGFNHHQTDQDNKLMPLIEKELPIVSAQYNSALKQIGTLGGGNHFIEIQKGDDGYIWVMIHSGSRNIGKQVADHYNAIAKDMNKKYYSSVPLDQDLAFLPIGTKQTGQYIDEMKYCVDFALANRKLMMNRVMDIIGFEFFPSEMINIAHNYASLENHFGSNVWVHRKGATLARKGTIGIIPSSQGAKSYIVEGKGNKDSFESCSHGAGRRMGRKQAERELDLDAEQKHLEDMGVIHSVRNKSDLDEAPSAYKDIDVVMDNQKDLVDIMVELTPLGVIKG